MIVYFSFGEECLYLCTLCGGIGVAGNKPYFIDFVKWGLKRWFEFPLIGCHSF